MEVPVMTVGGIHKVAQTIVPGKVGMFGKKAIDPIQYTGR